ncbi:MAG TPA: hypothetical protein PLI99_02430 [archaeon]|nr:hypothetical protein [archaeon]
MISKRVINQELFKKRKMLPSLRNTQTKLTKVNQVKSRKLVSECKKLTTILNLKLMLPNSRKKEVELKRLAQRISDWEKRADKYVALEGQLLGKMNPNTPTYERIHLLRNELTILKTILEMAEKSGHLEKGYTKKALNLR